MDFTGNQPTPDNLAILRTCLEERFHAHPERHPEVVWRDVEKRLSQSPEKWHALFHMEATGGEPDVVGGLTESGEFCFMDCVSESPTGRRSLCYDEEARHARKQNKPEQSALGLAAHMGVSILTEADYLRLQQVKAVDTKTSSWLQTPDAVRRQGGAIFGDFRFGRVFVYHNGAESYYAARGFRAKLLV